MKLFNFLLVAFLMLSLYARAQQANYTTINDISYRLNPTDDYTKQRCILDLYYPNDKEGYATIVWFHGGGLKEGEKHIPEQFKEQGFAVIAVNYRKSPNAKHPAYIDDAAASVAWAFNNIEKYGGDSEKIFVSGHSAGGYLTLMIGLDEQWLKKYSIDIKKIAALFPISGQAITHSTIREECKIDERHRIVDQYAPLYHTRSNVAPLYLITGDRNLELSARYEENALLYAYMKSMNPTTVFLFELDGFDHGQVVAPACFLIVNSINEILQKGM
ncbi:MAG TPA: alpha/beta hydrolase [Prolixibacteraceae bacterium]|nr:alpha/beta hydrolase [Prolixibacteraceae bacterium]